MSLQRSTHSLQIYELGPAINFFTFDWDLPQKEQFNFDLSFSIVTFSELKLHQQDHT